MKLEPASDSKKSHTKCYVPNNSLWVRDSTPQEDPPNLSEIAKRYSPKDSDPDSETQALVKPGIRFVIDNDLTNGSVAVEGESVVVGADKSDRIYRVIE